MSGMTINADVIEVRPSRLVAEALVHGHDLNQVERRARALGIPQDIARVVAAVGCRCREGNDMMSSTISIRETSLQS